MKISSKDLKKYCDMQSDYIDWNAVVANLPKQVRNVVVTEVINQLENLQRRIESIDGSLKNALGRELIETRLTVLDNKRVYMCMLNDDVLLPDEQPVLRAIKSG